MQARIEKSSGTADTVVLVEVLRADYTEKAQPDWHPWRGTVVRQRILKGHTNKDNFQIDRTGSTTACDDLIPVPKAGDVWVLYLKGDEQVPVNGPSLGAFPLDVARQYDPWLDTLLKNEP